VCWYALVCVGVLHVGMWLVRVGVGMHGKVLGVWVGTVGTVPNTSNTYHRYIPSRTNTYPRYIPHIPQVPTHQHTPKMRHEHDCVRKPRYYQHIPTHTCTYQHTPILLPDTTNTYQHIPTHTPTHTKNATRA